MEPNKRELVLPPGSYAYMQDLTKGVVKTYTGPTVVNPTAQERPIAYDAAAGKFVNVNTLEEAMQISPVAPEGHYIILRNPASKHPDEGSNQPSPDQEVGRTIIVPGPATFALWPGQTADVIEGHHLRSNQYLQARVYNEDEARRNWDKAVVKAATTTPTTPGAEPTTAKPTSDSVTRGERPPLDLTVGKQLIIRGTEVSFYIPPTGIEVVPVDEASANGRYVRDALTLEQLEYAILVDENGKKRYEIGPQVVFPAPSERFILSRDDDNRETKKLRAIELNDIQGIHIKVIANYEEGGHQYKEGEELFITGKDTKIYFPRQEHSAVKYDGRSKHFATAIPAGEARYVMNRLTGEIRTVKGPAMLLPDPRSEVIVRRVLTEKQCELWYPSNTEAIEYNKSLRSILQNVPTTRQGAVSEGDVQRGSRNKLSANALVQSVGNYMESSNVSRDQRLGGDEFSRSSTYTTPRTITLETKYQGAPSVDVWTGYAVLVVSKTGKRRVERGPTTVLLEYDEVLEILELSTGKPKNTDKLLRLPYLRVDNNKVSDIIEVETADHVNVRFKLSYLVNFEGDSTKWFAVDNYVKFLCDHTRSILKGQSRRLKVEDLYATSTEFVRNTLLGESKEGTRQGMFFPQNGMRICDVEVLSVELLDERIRPMLIEAQHNTVKTNIELSTARRNLEVFTAKQEIAREQAEAQELTSIKQAELSTNEIQRQLELSLAKITGENAETMRRFELEKNEQVLRRDLSDADLARAKTIADQNEAIALASLHREMQKLEAETKEIVARATAVSPALATALTIFSDNALIEKISTSLAPFSLMSGMSAADVLSKLFAGTPMAEVMTTLGTRSRIPAGIAVTK